MAEKTKRKIAFPMVARYNEVVRYFVEEGLHQTYIMQPKMTRRTLKLGVKYAPDMVCTPFKTILGSMIEALEAGADTLIMVFGYCRLGYYGELAETILRDLGYEFDYLNLAEYTTGKRKDYLKAVKKLNPKAKAVSMGKAGLDGLKMMENIDAVEDFYYQNCGFETTKGAYRKVLNRFMSDMEKAKNRSDIDAGYERCMNDFRAIPLDKGEFPLRVGVLGEYFTVMDEFSNIDLEQSLADLGVEVHRWMNVSHRNLHYPGEKNLHPRIQEYCTYEMGPTSTANIWYAKECAENGFDGLVHVKSAGCTPEIDIMPVLQRIGADFKIPILYLTYDSQDGDAGLQTRIEAFYDMIEMRKKVIR